MSNIIQIKSGSLPPPNGTLENFELGYVTNDGCLYIGVNEETVPVKVQAAESLVSNWGSFFIGEDVFSLEYGWPVLEFLYGSFLRITSPVNGSGEILLSEDTIELIDPGSGRAAIKITPGFTKIIDNQNNDRLVVGWNGTTTIMNQQYGRITISNDYIELVDGWGGAMVLESGNLRFVGNTYFNNVLCDIPAMQADYAARMAEIAWENITLQNAYTGYLRYRRNQTGQLELLVKLTQIRNIWTFEFLAK